MDWLSLFFYQGKDEMVLATGKKELIECVDSKVLIDQRA